jgi:hypothetical protein
LIFTTFELLRSFIEECDDITIPFAKFGKFRELTAFDLVEDNTIILKNVWTTLNTGFINTYA